jgi:hypothetical protein
VSDVDAVSLRFKFIPKTRYYSRDLENRYNHAVIVAEYL